MPKVVFEKGSSSGGSNSPSGCLSAVIVGIGIMFFAAMSSNDEPSNDSPSTNYNPTESIELDANVQQQNLLGYKSSCGDNFVENIEWYRVVGDSKELNNIKSNYCGDSFLRNNSVVQVASFISEQKALDFAELLQQETGSSFWTEKYSP